MDDQMKKYQEEAKERWGNTKAYKQSMERTKNWTGQDYKNAAEGWKKFGQELADTMEKGYNGPEFQALISRQHESINTFYDCSDEMFRTLGNMYADDPRFRKTYEDLKPGLSETMKQAINFYCDERAKKTL